MMCGNNREHKVNKQAVGLQGSNLVMEYSHLTKPFAVFKGIFIR